MFLIFGFQHFLQSRHCPPCCGAGHVAFFVTTVEVLGQLLTGPWFTIGEDNLIVKLSGLCFKYFFTHASLVGIQCIRDGVNLQTAKIFWRCSRSWTSPESCHLKTSGFFELINSAMASTHRGCLIAASLLYCASCTTLKT